MISRVESFALTARQLVKSLNSRRGSRLIVNGQVFKPADLDKLAGVQVGVAISSCVMVRTRTRKGRVQKN